MELRDYALGIQRATTLAGKLSPPPSDLTDGTAGPPLAGERPARPPDLKIVPGSKAKTPSIEGMPDPAQRIRILHAFANHELQAVELFAFAILAFPESPVAFRRGLVRILGEEQEHCRLYIDRLVELGGRFGDHPVSGYFWSKADDLTSPLRFVCAMALTFESANLDHALDHEAAARAIGDERTAAIIRRVHDEEIGHVRFGWHWLGKFKPAGQSMLEAYRANVTWPLRPALARGPNFHPESRRDAGLDEEFVRSMAVASRTG